MQVDTHRRQLLTQQQTSQTSFAQARLWLGISCVGATTLLAAFFLLIDLPRSIFRNEVDWSVQDLSDLAVLFVAWTMFLLPFDVYGGFLLPRIYQRPQFEANWRLWLKGVVLQGLLFVSTASAFLWVGRRFGVTGAAILLVLLQLFYVLIRKQLLRFMLGKISPLPRQLQNAVQPYLSEWEFPASRVLLAEHEDQGFTGGVCDLPGRETIVMPVQWSRRLHSIEFAALIARRLEVCRSGGRLQGLIVASGWNLSGFLIALALPEAGVKSVSELATTCLWFTLWTFLGLLLLPTLSRRSTCSIDDRVTQRGVPEEVLRQSLAKVQEIQNEATQRSPRVETIFYPVPSLQNRFKERPPTSQPGAWNAARNMLYLSWAGMGFLSRAVHCNCGRPELWVLLPTD